MKLTLLKPGDSWKWSNDIFGGWIIDTINDITKTKCGQTFQTNIFYKYVTKPFMYDDDKWIKS